MRPTADTAPLHDAVNEYTALRTGNSHRRKCWPAGQSGKDGRATEQSTQDNPATAAVPYVGPRAA